MGIYLNPGNSGFVGIRNDLYVDKSGLIGLVNEAIETPRRLICVSRPRRFGKSFAAKMLCAYYDRSCDSSRLFEDLSISTDEKMRDSYRDHLNQYDVIYLDMTNLMGKVEAENMLSFIQDSVTEELVLAYPGFRTGNTFDETLLHAVELTGKKFIMIIDEWDAPIREIPDIQMEYLRFLRMLFKSSGTTDKIFAAVYMTGILPIKKDGSQSAISDFKEFTIVNPRRFAEYMGFTEAEVKELCQGQDCDFSLMKQWYDGYTLEGIPVYNPNAVMEALRNREFASYWTETSASKSLMEYISLDYDGMSETSAKLLGGIAVPVDTNGFANDLVNFRDRDDVLTLLIHLGYLAYDKTTGTVCIPNEEIRLEFARTVRRVNRDDTIRRVKESDQLILDTIHGNAEAVAAQIEKIHREETAHLFYSGEQSLRSVVKLAYFSYKDQYIKLEELPSGDGYVDLVYLPKRFSSVPALVIELKWNQAAQGAIAQIKERRYPEALAGYGGEILLVGISYEKDGKKGERKHTCVIERTQVLR